MIYKGGLVTTSYQYATTHPFLLHTLDCTVKKRKEMVFLAINVWMSKKIKYMREGYEWDFFLFLYILRES